MPRDQPTHRGALPCEGNPKEGEHADDLSRPDAMTHPGQQPWPPAAVYVDGNKYSARPPWESDETIRTRGLRETTCRVDYESGILLCHHRQRAPKNQDCRQWFCGHRAEMRTRLQTRHRVALEKKKLAEQS